MNTPKHTANGWIQYRFDKGVLKRLSAGIGVYFVGKRPVMILQSSRTDTAP